MDVLLDERLECLRERKWYLFLLSSIYSYVIGILIVLMWQCFCKRRHDEPFIVLQQLKNDRNGKREDILDIDGAPMTNSEAVTSKSTTSSRILEGVIFLCNMASFIIYMLDASNEYVETCQLFYDSTILQIDVLFSVFFLICFFLRLLAASDKLQFMFEIYTLVDFFTIPPALLSVYLGRTWIGFRSLRVLYIASIPKFLQYFHLLQAVSSINVVQLIFGSVAFVLASAGFVHLLENSGDPFEFQNSQKLSYETCAYFLVVTMTTVGYGDVFCVTILGRIFIILFLVFGPMLYICTLLEVFNYAYKEVQRNDESLNLSGKNKDEDDDTSSSVLNVANRNIQSNSTLSLPAGTIQEDIVINAIAYFIVENNLPLVIVEDKGFKRFIQTLIPGFKMPSRNILAVKTIPAFHIQFNEIFKSELRSVKYISATLNESKSPNRNSRISLIVTFVSSLWTLESRELITNHSTDNHHDLISEILQEFDISNEKITSITTAVSSKCEGIVKQLGIRHIPCFDNLIHTLTKEIFSMQKVNNLVDKIIEVYNIMNSERDSKSVEKIPQNDYSPSQSKWYILRQMEFINSNKMKIDKFFKTREHGKYTKLLLTAVEHEINEELIELLHPLEEFNKILKDITTPTASLLLTVANKLRITTKITEHTDVLIVEVKNQLTKFAEQLSAIYCHVQYLDMAQYFDPRVSINNENLDKILAALRIDYQGLNRNKCGLEMLFENDHEVEGDKTSTLYNEFVLYNSQPGIQFSENPLTWWKNQTGTYPILSKICKKYLSMQATSVSREAIF